MGENDRWALSGRISTHPDELLHEEVLKQQFDYELEHFLSHYIRIEKVLLLEYRSMNLIQEEELQEITAVLEKITAESLTADPKSNMSDIAFAIECFVNQRLSRPVPAWHVDRSRNDMQACAQLMAGRKELLELADHLFAFFDSIHRLASRTVDMPMPGYTHYQIAQVITPGYYLAALCESTLNVLNQLLHVYDGINYSPLGSGAMAGQELEWDLGRMAKRLGFDGPCRHALMGVASRDWRLRIGAELSQYSLTLSRFVSDLMIWGSSGYQMIDLPDELSGISSAMPQKKNFPVLERIRGRTGHITAYYVDLAMGQRNTPYTNLVETSKEGGTHFATLCETMRSVLRLFTAVVEGLTFKEERMESICQEDFIGGFTLANTLTLQFQIPYREAQVIVGKYITAAMEQGLSPQNPDAGLLTMIGKQAGYNIEMEKEAIQDCFDARYNLYGKKSSNSAAPKAVYCLLKRQEQEIDEVYVCWEARRERVEGAFREL